MTEFNDIEGREYGDPKKWPMFHTDDITCAAVKLGEGVVTATYSGEIIFWKLETGQPYRFYSVLRPNKFIEVTNKTNNIQFDFNLKFPISLSLTRKKVVDNFCNYQENQNIKDMPAYHRHIRVNQCQRKCIHPDVLVQLIKENHQDWKSLMKQ